MEKTYYKNLVISEKNSIFTASVEISDQREGFYMPIKFEGGTKEEALNSALDYLGDNAEKINNS